LEDDDDSFEPLLVSNDTKPSSESTCGDFATAAANEPARATQNDGEQDGNPWIQVGTGLAILGAVVGGAAALAMHHHGNSLGDEERKRREDEETRKRPQ
jgi:hypothetical protein